MHILLTACFLPQEYELYEMRDIRVFCSLLMSSEYNSFKILNRNSKLLMNAYIHIYSCIYLYSKICMIYVNKYIPTIQVHVYMYLLISRQYTQGFTYIISFNLQSKSIKQVQLRKIGLQMLYNLLKVIRLVSDRGQDLNLGPLNVKEYSLILTLKCIQE